MEGWAGDGARAGLFGDVGAALDLGAPDGEET